MKPTLISLFAGIGGLDLAAHWAGFETIRFVEKEPFCQKVLAKHWPNVPIDDDVFTSHPEHADVVCGGFPCQPFSVAGSQRGRDDERYLLPEMLRIVREVKPYAVLFENVPGFPSLNDGAEFKYLLGALAEMGFDAQWGHIRAKDAGAPHQRERWFCVAYSTSSRLEGFKWAELQGRGIRPTISSETMADTFINGDDISGQRRIDGNKERDSSQTERGRVNQQSRAIAYGEIMGNAASLRCQRDNERSQSNRFQQGRSQEFTRGSGRQTQSQLGGTSHGLSNRLDFVGFPARPGEPQHAYEPPRTAPSTPTTNARIKALGNAVVPQVAYPIFTALAEWFAEMEKEKAA